MIWRLSRFEVGKREMEELEQEVVDFVGGGREDDGEDFFRIDFKGLEDGGTGAWRPAALASMRGPCVKKDPYHQTILALLRTRHSNNDQLTEYGVHTPYV